MPTLQDYRRGVTMCYGLYDAYTTTQDFRSNRAERSPLGRFIVDRRKGRSVPGYRDTYVTFSEANSYPGVLYELREMPDGTRTVYIFFAGVEKFGDALFVDANGLGEDSRQNNLDASCARAFADQVQWDWGMMPAGWLGCTNYVLCGHSWGGVAATNLAARWKHDGLNVSELWTFGMPRLTAINTWNELTGVSQYHFTAHNDPTAMITPGPGWPSQRVYRGVDPPIITNDRGWKFFQSNYGYIVLDRRADVSGTSRLGVSNSQAEFTPPLYWASRQRIGATLLEAASRHQISWYLQLVDEEVGRQTRMEFRRLQAFTEAEAARIEESLYAQWLYADPFSPINLEQTLLDIAEAEWGHERAMELAQGFSEWYNAAEELPAPIPMPLLDPNIGILTSSHGRRRRRHRGRSHATALIN